jgi:hypothetical protein
VIWEIGGERSENLRETTSEISAFFDVLFLFALSPPPSPITSLSIMPTHTHIACMVRSSLTQFDEISRFFSQFFQILKFLVSLRCWLFNRYSHLLTHIIFSHRPSCSNHKSIILQNMQNIFTKFKKNKSTIKSSSFIRCPDPHTHQLHL